LLPATGVPLLFVYFLYSNRAELRGDRSIEVATAARAAKLERRGIHRNDEATEDPQIENRTSQRRGGVIATNRLEHIPTAVDFDTKEGVIKRCKEIDWEKLLPAISEYDLMEVRRRDVNLNGLHLLFDTYRPEVHLSFF